MLQWINSSVMENIIYKANIILTYRIRTHKRLQKIRMHIDVAVYRNDAQYFKKAIYKILQGDKKYEHPKTY